MRRFAPAALAATSVTAAVALFAGSCTAVTHPSGGAASGPLPAAEVQLRLASALEPFDACGGLLDHVRAEASAQVAAGTLAAGGAMGGDVLRFDGRAAGLAGGLAGPAVPSAAADSAKSSAESAAPEAPGPQISGTNTQEAGVDEPDLVKTDGRRIVTLTGGRLQVLVVEDGKHRLAGGLSLPLDGGDGDLLMSGDRVLVRSSTWAQDPVPGTESKAAGGVEYMRIAGHPRTRLTLVDVADPEEPSVLSTFEVDGTVLGARMVGDVARVVTSAAPKGIGDVSASTLRNWLPEYTLAGPDGSGIQPVSGIAVDCGRVSRPAAFSGLGTISVLTFDLSEGLSDGDAVTVLADGQTVYASERSLYVATTRYAEVAPADGPASIAAPGPVGNPEETTQIHQFDISGAGPARHLATGTVRGHLLNQFSMSEHDGRLRVATTDGSARAAAGDRAFPPEAVSESLVTVLEPRGGVLEAAGQVGGLGRGEQIYAVRFMGPVGYVVTFRQTDPLYTLDLSDAARPRVVGELKIPGYSAYLHSVGDGLLMGVGQDATEQGRRIGAQASLFDVSDPANPRRLDQVSLGQGQSAAEFDHHAFLWWAPRGLAVLPLQVYDEVAGGSAVGLSVDRSRGLGEVGRITHRAPLGEPSGPGGYAFIERSLVIDDTLYTFSPAGVLSSDLGDLSGRDWVGYPGR